MRTEGHQLRPVGLATFCQEKRGERGGRGGGRGGGEGEGRRERGEGRGGRVEERQKRDTVKMFSSCSTLIPTDPRPINFDTLSART